MSIAKDDVWQKAWDEVDSWVKKREVLYHTFTVSSLIVLLIAVVCWWFPNLFPGLTPYLNTADGQSIKVFFLWQWIYDFATYITPVMFENFLTFIIKVYPVLFTGLAAAFYMMSSTRKSILKNLQVALENFRSLLVNASTK